MAGSSTSVVQKVLVGGGILFFLAGMAVVSGLPAGIPQLSIGDAGIGTGTTEPVTTTQAVTQTTAATTKPTTKRTTRTTTTATRTTRTTTSTTRSQGRVLYRVNLGGPRIRIPGGTDWQADTEQNPSQFGNQREAGSRVNDTEDHISVTPAVPDGTPRRMFQSRRFGDGATRQGDFERMQYQFPVPDGEYVVRVYLAETYIDGDGWNANSKIGPRVFDIAVEGQVVLNNYNMYQQLGHDRGTMKSFQPTVTDGALFVTFLHEKENPFVSGISIVRVGDADGGQSGDRERGGSMKTVTDEPSSG